MPAAEPTDPPRPRGSGFVGAVGQVLLTAAAAVGLLCILAVPAALWFGISFTLFSTGSMAPTIPAGSVAVVREIPASRVQVGDVVTVERPGDLPVTHRVRQISPGPGEERILVLRGDANADDDAAPYHVTRVRLVLFSVPGLAPAVASLSNPLVLGGLTVAAAGLVLWAFWPRRHAGAAAFVVVVILATGATPAPPASAEVRERVVSGPVITLVSIGDDQAMTSLSPGVPVHWQVGVLSDPPEPGTVTVAIRAAGALTRSDDGLQVSVVSCPQRWVDDRCPTGATDLLGSRPARTLTGDDHHLADLVAGQPQWLLVTAWLSPEHAPPNGQATVRISAAGFGDAVATGQDRPLLPNTGADRLTTVVAVLGLGALVTGTVLLVAHRRPSRHRAARR